MKKVLAITGFLALGAGMISCGGANGKDQGQVYMPDMWYSRAYETYGYNSDPKDHDLKSRGAYYTGIPVRGTMARGDAFSFPAQEGDSGYVQAATLPSPLATAPITAPQMKEAERLYLINCAICHGSALDGNGPLWKGGDGPYPAAPRNLKDDYTKKLSDGQIFHVITYGKGQMGSYASQLYPEQRWWVTAYIRSKQGPAATATAAADSATATPPSNATGSGISTNTSGASAVGGTTGTTGTSNQNQ
jgi:mono/diheme cytochrome c family protein